ncbi:hypothetical protein D3C78_1085350 [compost metagenome]
MGEDRPQALDVVLRTTGHDRQAAGLGARRAAGHRRIDPAHAAALLQLDGHLAGGARLAAGEVDQQLPRQALLDDAAGAEHHLAYRRGIGQAEHDDVGLEAQVARMVDHLGAGIHQRLALGRVAVPHTKGKTGRQQAAAHRQAHQADAGKGQGGQGIAHVHLRNGGKAPS